MPAATTKPKKRADGADKPKTVTLRASVDEHQKFYDICSEMQRGSSSRVSLNNVMHNLIDGFVLGGKKTHRPRKDGNAELKSVSLAIGKEDKLKIWQIALEMSGSLGERISENGAMCQLIRDYPLESKRAKRSA